MKKLIPIMLVAILLPQVAFAAWWNPFSWFKEQDLETEKAELLQRLAELEAKVNSQDTETDATSSPAVSDSSTKVITQTTKVDSPELQTKIDFLLKENVSLRAQILSQSSLIQSLNQCKSDLINTRSNDASPTIFTNTADIEKENKLKGIDSKILPILESFLAQGAGYGNLSSIENFKNLDETEINQLLASYRVVDSSMTYLNIETRNSYGFPVSRETQFQVAQSLYNYLKSIYIPYR